MSFELQPRTEEGRACIDAATAALPVLEANAAAADASGEFPRASFDELVRVGLTGAFVPTELGGFGLQSMHDWIALIATLARGDSSLAIAINMQLGVSRGMAMAFRQAQAKGRETAALSQPLTAIARGDMRICATATEPGTDNLHPLTEAVADGDGYRINGRKIFVTMSPIATHLAMNLRMRDADGDHLVTTMLPMDTAGLQPQGDWDALGMRGSGSQSVVFTDVLVPKRSIRPIGPWGQWSVSMLASRALSNLPLVGAFLGTAEAAHAMALDKVKSATKVGGAVAERPGIQHHVGEAEIELATCRTILAAAGTTADAFVARQAQTAPSLEDGHRLMQSYQSAKWVVNRGAIDIVSRAMDVMGGAGYTNAHPLARMYRDVRAGPFMQPFAPTEAREYVGRVALGQYPVS